MEDPESGRAAHPSHLDARGHARMVDVSQKGETERLAIASGRVRMADATREILFRGVAAKGDVLAAARIAGIQAAKRTADLIPLCHSLPLSEVRVEFSESADGVRIEAMARTVGRTGVEMEALTAVSVAGLTIYDMLKSVDRGMVLSDVRLERKEGGRSGVFERSGP